MLAACLTVARAVLDECHVVPRDIGTLSRVETVSTTDEISEISTDFPQDPFLEPFGILWRRADFCKPFSVWRFFGRGERIRTSGLYVPNVALYRAKLHPDWCDRRFIAPGSAVNRRGRYCKSGWLWRAIPGRPDLYRTKDENDPRYNTSCKLTATMTSAPAA